MKENELEIQNNVRVNFGKRNRKVFRGNRPLLCKECVESHGYSVESKEEQFATARKGVQYEYRDGVLKCPNCGRELVVLKDYDTWVMEQELLEKEARENLHLFFYDKSWETGIEYYRLSSRIDFEEWVTVEDYFVHFVREEGCDEQDTVYGNILCGWFTTKPREVEKILGIREDLTLDYRDKVKKEKEKQKMEKVGRRNELKEIIFSYFEDMGEKPVDVVLSDLNGDVLEPKEYGWNVYGGGYRFVICDDGLWFIRNNCFDGADWSKNNVRTGSAGAIGLVVPYDESLDCMIREYCSL